jgi:hypothetical protein
MLRRVLLGVGAATLALSMSATIALAGNPSLSGTGQPSVSCGDVLPYSPNGFLTAGFAVAASVYANPAITGSTGGVASGNVKVVSQYDVACIQLSLHPH